MGLSNGFNISDVNGRVLFSSTNTPNSYAYGKSAYSDDRTIGNTGQALGTANNGIGFASTGQMALVDTGGGGLPAGTTFQNGLPFDTSGNLVVDTVSAIAGWSVGVPVVASGAVAATISA